MTEQNRVANAQSELAVARDALRVARAALQLGIARDALSRAFYAAFHAARALLLLDGIEPKTHSGVMGMFSAHWVRTGRVESAQMLVLTRLQSYRLASDYAYSFDVQVADALGEIDAAERFVELAARLVGLSTP